MTEFLSKLFSSQAFKAWAAAVTTLAGTYATAVADGVVDGTEIGFIIGTVLAALGVVYRVKNKRAE